MSNNVFAEPQYSGGEWGQEAALSSDVDYIRLITADQKIIGKVRHRPGQSQEEALANARLMAGAKTLLEEAMALVEVLRKSGIDPEDFKGLEKAIASSL